MNSIPSLQSIQTAEKSKIQIDHPDLPEATSYEAFKVILKNETIVRDAKYTPIRSIDDIIIAPDSANRGKSDEEKIYAIEKTQDIELNGGPGTAQIQLCYITGKAKLQDFLAKYIREDILLYQKNVSIQINETADQTEVQMTTQAELGNLQANIIDIEYSEQGTKEFFNRTHQEAIHITKQYEHRLNEIKKQEKRRLQSSPLENEMFALCKFTAEESIRNIERLKQSIDSLQTEQRKGLLTENTRTERTKQIQQSLRDHSIQQDNLGKIIGHIVTNSNQVMPVIDIRLPITSSAQADKVHKAYKRMALERIMINDSLAKTNLHKITSQQGESLYAYLEKSLTQGTKEEFVPSAEHAAAFAQIKQTQPLINKMLEDATPEKVKSERKAKKEQEERTAQRIYSNPEAIVQGNTTQKKGGLLDKLTPGFITDVIDNTNMTPEAKNRCKTGAGLLFLIGAGLLAWKTLKGAGKALSGKAEAKDRGRLAAGTVIFGGSLIASGNPLNRNKSLKDLGNTLGGIFASDRKNIASSSPDASIESQTIYGFNSLNILFAGRSYAEINSVIKKDSKGIMHLDYDGLETALTNNTTIENRDTRLAMVKSLKNNKNPKLFHLAMTTMGLTPDKLENPDNANVVFDETAAQALKKFVDIAGFMEKEGYTNRNPELTTQIQKYISTGSPSLKVLEAVGAFERENTIPNDPSLKAQIEALTTINDNEKENLLYNVQKLKQELENKKQYTGKIEIREINNKLVMKTYDQETSIDYADRAIDNGTGSAIKLVSTYEMLKAANLTNRLKDIFSKQSESNTPFNISITGNIEFEKTKPLNLKGIENPWEFMKAKIDTQALDAGRRGTLENISPTLESKKQEYKDFLNTMNIRTS